MSLSDSDTGIWIVRTQKHLQDFIGTSPLNNYDCTIVSGLCGRLMARIRKLEVIDFQKLNILASDIGIMKSMLRDVIVPALASEGVINVKRDNTGSILRVEEDIPPVESIPRVITEIWDKRQPEGVEMATIEAQSICSGSPCQEEELREFMRNKGHNATEIGLSISNLHSKSWELLNSGQGSDFFIRNISGETLLRRAANGYQI